MVRRLAVRTGATGYRDQLDRLRRYLAKVLDQERPGYLVDYQDDVWSFFLNCWHLKDWVRHDPLVPDEKRARVKTAVEASRTLAIANDIANGAKHLRVYDRRAGAAYSHTEMTMSGPESRLECVIDVEGAHVTASVLAQACVDEWERILSAEQLPTEPMGT